MDSVKATRTGLGASIAGLLLAAGLLAGPASAAEPPSVAARTGQGGAPTRHVALVACAFANGDALTTYGQRGARVRQAQCLLANRHYLSWRDLTGRFDAKTRSAVREFQSRHRLPVSGKVDKKTWRALYS
ncbi:peptidoglycan-binding domain-containing protein [Streptomyces sp. NPDC057743]|uniref:peptidoglycan-binding domain-containing protein n=1 Tax=Streptomyces sp. NPDC057743 TaxID=3346236 RepID=UPI0036B14994